MTGIPQKSSRQWTRTRISHLPYRSSVRGSSTGLSDRQSRTTLHDRSRRLVPSVAYSTFKREYNHLSEHLSLSNQSIQPPNIQSPKILSPPTLPLSPQTLHAQLIEPPTTPSIPIQLKLTQNRETRIHLDPNPSIVTPSHQPTRISSSSLLSMLTAFSFTSRSR